MSLYNNRQEDQCDVKAASKQLTSLNMHEKQDVQAHL